MDNQNNHQRPKNQKKKRRSIFFRSIDKDGPGVSKTEAVVDYGFLGFFKLYFRRFGTLFSINLIYIFGNFPLLVGLFATSGMVFAHQSLFHQNILYPAFRGILINGLNPVTAALNGAIGTRGVTYILHTPAYVMQYIAFALFCVTFGLVNVGCAYILRNMIKGEPVFLMSDFFYAIKRNWKQGVLMGIIDIGICYLLYMDIIFWNANANSFLHNYLFYFSILLAVLYYVMRFYLYPMLVTFRLSIFKLIKNAAIFAAVGMKRNFLALLGSLAVLLLAYGVFYTYVPLGVVLPLTILIATLAFIATFAAWGKIKEVMIDPYETDESDDEDDEKPIFRDDVTERERLEAYKRAHGRK